MKQRQRGSALLISLVVTMMIAVLTGFLFNQAMNTDRQTRMPRIRSAMTRIEGQLRDAAFGGTLLVCPPAPASCTINPGVLASFSENIPGAKCPAGLSQCGVIVDNATISGMTFSARIQYQGDEIAVKPVVFTQSLDVGLSPTATCPVTSPFFIGVNPDRSPICRSLPTDCASGQYVQSVDPMRLTSVTPSPITCASLPSAISCGANAYMNQLSWTSPGSLDFLCQPRPDPFTLASLGGNPTAYSSKTTNWMQPVWPAAPCLVCPPDSTETGIQWIAVNPGCTAPQTGTYSWEKEQTQTRTVTYVCGACPNPIPPPTFGAWSAWVDTGATRNMVNTCSSASCLPCPADTTETETQWVFLASACPVGQTGTRTCEEEQRRTRAVTYSCPACPSTAPSPTYGAWSAWANTGATRNNVNTCTSAPAVYRICSFTSYTDNWTVGGNSCVGGLALFGLITMWEGEYRDVYDISWGFSVSPAKGMAKFYCDPAKLDALVAAAGSNPDPLTSGVGLINPCVVGSIGLDGNPLPAGSMCQMFFSGANTQLSTVPVNCSP